MICTDRGPGVFKFKFPRNFKSVQVTMRLGPCQCMPVRTHPGRGRAVPVAVSLTWVIALWGFNVPFNSEPAVSGLRLSVASGLLFSLQEPT